MAIGALGTFLGIFNTAEINNIRREMATMNNNQNLLIQVQKIHTDQINRDSEKEQERLWRMEMENRLAIQI